MPFFGIYNSTETQWMSPLMMTMMTNDVVLFYEACVVYATYYCWSLQCYDTVGWSTGMVVLSVLYRRGVQNPMKMSDIGFLNSKTENSVSAVRFSKNQLQQFGDGFSRCLIRNSCCSMIGSTVKVFFFMPYLCSSSSESVRLTISWTNSARKYVISSVIP